jgi:hypothetical protein
MLRDSAIVLGAFALTAAVAELLGAANLGTALGIGQLGFVAALCWVLFTPMLRGD